MDLVSFATELLDALGGVVERDGPDAFRVLLEPGLAARVGLPEEARLTDPTAGGAREGDGIALAHGSDVVARLIGEALGAGRVAWLAADVAPPRVKTVDGALRAALHPLNGVLRIEEVLPGTAEYLVVGFRYCATGDERREGLVDVAVSPDGAATATGLPEVLWSNDHVLRDARPIAAAPIAPAAWRAAALLARRRVVDALAPVREIVAHRLERDVLRLHGYYRTMQAEILRSAARRAVAAADAEKVLARANGIPAEFQRRVAEARARLALRVAVRPALAVRLSVPALFARVRLLRRKQERELLLRCDGLQRAFEVPLCEACSASAAAAPALCDERVHLLCDECFRECPACGARTCPACQRRCRKCGAPLGAPVAVPGARPSANAAGPTQAAAAAPPSAPPAQDATCPASPARCTQSQPPLPDASRSPAPPAPATEEPTRTFRPSAPPAPPSDAGHRGARALASMAETLGRSFSSASPEERVRQALRSLGQAGTTLLARQTALPPDVVCRAVAHLRARGEVTHVGHGRGTKYRLA